MEILADTDGRLGRATKTPGWGRDEFVTPAPRRVFTTLTTPGNMSSQDATNEEG